jgi:osmotically-inducible protein OsmY
MATPAKIRADDQIQQDVVDELSFDARVQPNEVGVIVKDGVVTLTGWVDSYLKKWAAEEAAHRVPGVVAVANDIEAAKSRRERGRQGQGRRRSSYQ